MIFGTKEELKQINNKSMLLKLHHLLRVLQSFERRNTWWIDPGIDGKGKKALKCDCDTLKLMMEVNQTQKSKRLSFFDQIDKK